MSYWVIVPDSTFSFFSTQFTAANQYINFTNVLAYEYTQTWTISCWIKAGSLVQNYKTILGKVLASPYRGYELQIKNQTIEVDLGASATNFVEVHTTSNVITSTTAWFHVVWTNSGSGLGSGQKLWINGSSAAVSTLVDTLGGGTIVNSSANFTVGNRADATAAFTGTVDDVAVFNKVLSQSVITNLWNYGKPGNLAGFVNLALWCYLGDGDSATALNGYIDHSPSGFNGTGVNSTSANIVSDHP